MGKHSATDGQDDRDNRTAGGRDGRFGGGDGTGGGLGGGAGDRVFGGGPGDRPVRSGGPGAPGAPGSGRRRRGPAEESGYFTTLRPQDLEGAPPAHPEHREHAAWGDSGSWPVPPARRELARDPVEEWAADWAPYDAASARSSQAANAAVPRHLQASGRLLPRPRQEFVDAFDLPAAPPAPAPPEGTEAGTPPRTGGPGGSGGSGGSGGGRGSGTKGRTLSGIAAAAVVTVLAVVVGGQVHRGENQHTDGDGAEPRSTAGETPPTPDGTAATTPGTATDAPLGYDQQMAKQYPLSPTLSLSGSFTTVPGHQAAPGRGKVMRFRVDVEKGLPLDARLFSDTVFKTLNDPRSWGHGGKMTFERVSTGPADIIITLASPGTTDKWCAKSGLDTSVENVSCDAASTPRTMINAYRWARGAATYGPRRIHEYRQMLVNHEVGHRLGHGHVGCPKEGALAPVMMQQTKFLSLDGGPTCKPNAWPYP